MEIQEVDMEENMTQTAGNEAVNAGQQGSTGSTESTQGQATATSSTQTSAGDTGQTKQVDKSFTQADVDRIVKDRLDRETKKSGGYKQVYDALREAGYIDKDANPAEVLSALQQKRIDDAAQSGNTTEVARQTAMQAAKSEAMDVRIELTAQDLAEKDPLLADIMDRLDEVRPLARLLGGDKAAVKNAYLAIQGEAFLERFAKQHEAKTLANIEAKQNRRVESGDAGGDGEKLGLTSDELQVAKMLDMDPKEYAAMKKTADVGSYQKMKKK
jgi:hypothetical protein